MTPGGLSKEEIAFWEKCLEDEKAKAMPPVAGSLLKVIERPMLTNGGLSSAPNGIPVILIAADQPHQQKLVTLWHEVVHLMRMAGGYTQDEASVEDAAQRLATACPEALTWVGIHEANDLAHSQKGRERGPDNTQD